MNTNNNFKIRIIFYAILVMPFFGIGQAANSYFGKTFPKAPEVEAFERINNISVGYTGVPDISVPITSITEGSINVGLTASYDASGLKIADVASKIGTGWNLSGVGMISRSQLGNFPDERATGMWDVLQQYPNADCTDNQNLYMVNMRNGSMDRESDIFSYNINGKGGKFYIKYISANQYEIVQMPKSDVKIEFALNGGISSIYRLSQFVITDTDGTKYIFGSKVVGDNYGISKQITPDHTGVTNNYEVANAWYLVKMISGDSKSEINFEYLDNSYKFRTYSFDEKDKSEKFYESIISDKFLTRIVSSTEEILITCNSVRQDVSGDTKLKVDEIKKRSLTNTSFCSKWIFTYDYWVGTETVCPTCTIEDLKRLRLNEIQQRSCDDVIIKPAQKFEYTLDGNNLTLFPSRLSSKYDHWGYNNNGFTSNTPITEKLVIPSCYIDPLMLSDLAYQTDNPPGKDVDPSLAKIGTLKRMVHSTGGFTDFEFESNETNLYVATFDTIRNIPLYNFSFPGGYPGSLNASTCSYFYPSSIYTGYNFNYKFSAIGIAGGSGRNASVTMRNGSSCLSSPINFSTGTNPSIGIVTSQSGSINNIVLNSEYHFNYSITYAGLLFEIYAFKHTPYRNLNVKIGGLRIKKVDKNDGNALAETISYTYKDELDQNKSSGILHNRPNYWLLYCSVSPPNLQINHHFFTKKSSMFPISGFDGLHIRYDHISAEYIDGSKTKYKYLIETQTPLNENVGCSWNQGGQANTYPGNLIKNLVNVLDGKSIKITDTNNNNIGIKQSLNLYNDVSPYSIDQAYNYYVLNGPIKVPFRYQHRTKAPLLLSEETYLDGVVVNTVYTYDPTNRFTMPITKTFTNSDGKIHKEEYTYNHDYDNSAGLRDALLTKNIISSPFRTKVMVDGIHLDGPETGYAWFNLTTGNYQTNSAGAHPRQYQMYRFEKTFDASGNLLGTGGTTLQATINAYDTYGNIKQVTTPNWQPETFEWYSNGLLKKKTFINHINEYTYHTGTRLLSSIKDIDGQLTYFDYDKLSRLSKQVSRKVGAVENVKTDYTYHFKEPSGDIYNWIQTQTTYTATTNSNLVTRKVKEIMDGLGRPIQTIKVNHSPNSKDVVFAKSYDNKGRLWKEYLPVESTGNIGTFFTIPSNTKFTETLYEASPLNRPISVTPPGTVGSPGSWYATTISYGANSGTDVSNLSTGSNYAANALSKVITTDPMNNRTIVFKDKKGREVLTWKTNVSYSVHTKTYIMYDNKDRVTAIVPQGATLSTTPELTYKYTYDQDDKVLTKTIPGKGVEKILYNNRDLATFTQDAKWVAGKDWLHSKYDDYGRLLNNGRYTHSTTNDPSGDLNATYNDQYKEMSYFTLLSDGVKLGKIKQTKDKILGTSNTWIQKDMNYDTYGRVSTITGSNHLYNNINAESITTTYDFADNVMTENRTHKPSVSEQQIINKRWTYDASGRVKDHFTSLNGVESKISNQNYNFRDEMSEKNLGAATASGISTYLQSLDYSYNDQGWLTKINQPTLGGTNMVFPTTCTPAMPNPGVYTPAADPDPNDLYYMELNYDANTTGITGLPTNVQKSGNMAQIAWRVRGRDRQSYNYTYDFLNRMSASTYYDVNAANAATVSNRYNESLTYDLRSNILTMNRTGYYTDAGSCLYNTIDNLTYNYAANTNKLTSITDASATAPKPKGFNPGSGGAGFGYDLVGNLVSDTYKGITSITYNYLNLPSTIAWSTTKSIDFVYDATGNKLSKTVKTGATVNSIQDYVMGVEYNSPSGINRKIEAIYHAEGRYFNTSTTSTPAWRTEYSIKDHLGNSRISFTDKNLNGKIDVDNTVNNEILQENHYYAFGMTYDGPWMINDAAKDNPYQYNGKELNLDHGLNWSDYGARWYDACVGRWSSVDPLTEKFPGYSAYNYALNNPIRLIDPDGRAPAGYGDPIADIKQTLANTAATVQRNVTDAVNYTRNTVAPAVGSAAGVVGEIADYVQYAALVVTGITMGATAAATVPIAAGAEVVGNVALGVQFVADGVQNGNFNKTGSEVVVKLVAGTAGDKASKSIGAMTGATDATKHATNAVAQTMVNTTEKVANNLISNIVSDKKSSTSNYSLPSVAEYRFTVTDNNNRN